jgi:hypothetical protein
LTALQLVEDFGFSGIEKTHPIPRVRYFGQLDHSSTSVGVAKEKTYEQKYHLPDSFRLF